MPQKEIVPDSQLKALEEARRNRCWDPAARWKVLQETISWAEVKVGRNTKESRLEEQRQKLAGPETAAAAATGNHV